MTLHESEHSLHQSAISDLERREYNLTGVVVLVDVDQVLADMMYGHLQRYNNELNLEMTDREISDAARIYKSTFNVPQIMNKRSVDETAFNEVRKSIRDDVNLHRAFPVIPNAIQSLHALYRIIKRSQGEFGGYYTARTKATGAITYEWLSNNQFPQGPVYVSNDSKGKLEQIIENYPISHTSPRIVLIDDNVHGLIEAANLLVEERNHLVDPLSTITIAAFSYTERDEIPNTSPLSIVPFPNWEANTLENFIQAVSNR